MTVICPKTILVAEDFPPVVKIYRSYLKQMGFKDIDSANDGAEALKLIELRRYDLIISDWHMAPVSGFHLLERVRASRHHAEVPFIMATAESRPASLEAAHKAGVTAYLLKPFNVGVLRSTIGQACSRMAEAMDPPYTNPGVDVRYIVGSISATQVAG